ncbi:BtrH N-terminal domain-containing protein [Bacillus sp. SM2101]|uniref:BtrH N-terminal domain-containing protein n=1 Tax=Bacillus sp. SM2101 TaxID=2805366 RepID=UPI001BDE0A70|nr:BtrH N-terminal domain-containing protein [Bacillus sp. SM2101]
MSNRLVKDNSLNCFQLVITSLAAQQGVDKEELWFQSGLYFDVINNKILLDYQYKTLEEQFGENITFNTFNFNNDKDCLKTLDEHLMNENSVAVNVDVFELEYSVFFQEEHEQHLIEVYDKVKDKYQIYDHYYHYYGEITEDELKKGVSSYLINFPEEELKIYSLTVNPGNQKLSMEQLLGIIQENYNVMLGNWEVKNKDLKGYIGICGLREVKKSLVHTINNTFDTKQELYNELSVWFNSINNMSNSRTNFYRTLKKYIPEYDVSFLLESSQSWSSLGNMLLKGFHTDSLSKMSDRIEKRIDKLIHCENNSLNNLKSIIESLDSNILKKSSQ